MSEQETDAALAQRIREATEALNLAVGAATRAGPLVRLTTLDMQAMYAPTSQLISASIMRPVE